MKRLDTERVRLAVLHHSAHEPDQNSTAQAEAARIRRWHLKRGFHENGYQFVVFGNTYVAARPLLYRGAHCRHWNHVSIGICVCGDLTKRSPTYDEVSSVVSAVGEAERHFGHELVVVGHNQLASTLCPGPDLVRFVNDRILKNRSVIAS